jgi:bacterioferritin
MEGNNELPKVMNPKLADELTAINQYMVISELSENWGYGKLYMAIQNQTPDELPAFFDNKA